MRRIVVLSALIALLLPLLATARATLAAPARTPANLTFIHMSDTVTGWALAQHTVWYTTDSGASWRNVTPPGIARSHLTTLFQQNSAAFAGQQGWVAAQHLGARSWVYVFHTANGGRSWQRSNALGPQAQGVISLAFADVYSGWIMVSGDAGMGHLAYSIYHTTNGGGRWNRVMSTSPAPGGAGPLPSCNCPHGLTFQNAHTGWVTGDPYALNGSTWLYRTQDAGRTWARQGIPIPAAYRKAMIGTYPIWLFGGQGQFGVMPVTFTGARSNTFDLYTTSNGGASWRSTHAFPLRPANLVSESFIDARHGWVAAGFNDLYYTADGGAHWRNLSPKPPFMNINQIQFLDALHGYAVVSRGSSGAATYLLRTTDGGQSWTRM